MSYIDPRSVKKYHRKGFKGHKIADPNKGKKNSDINLPAYPPNQTNHQRMLLRESKK